MLMPNEIAENECVYMHVSVHVFMYMYVPLQYHNIVLYVHIYVYIFTMYKCNFKCKIPLCDGWGLLDQVVGVVVLLGEELLMCQGTVPRLD